MKIQMIALNQLVPSALNVRKTGAKMEIKSLAASIKAHGLLQNLQVKETSDRTYEVVAGGRRLMALSLLEKQGEVKATDKFPCHVLSDEDAQEISLAENVLRLPMHPADQYEAFRHLADAGKGSEEIAARFGVTASTVKQRLKLARVSPKLFAIYRKDGMSLDQLMAFTISDDVKAQEAAWYDVPAYQRSAHAIRQNLTAAHVEADDSRVQFIGIEAYKKAGGCILRDLFQPNHEGYLTDPALLDRLVTEKLERKVSTIRKEGWKWVEIAPDADHETLRTYGRVHAERAPLTAKEQKQLDKLATEYDALVSECGDEPNDETADRLEKLEEQMDIIKTGEPVWQQEALAQAGAILTIGYNGKLRIERGLVKPEDKKAVAASRKANASDGAVDEAATPYSAALVEDLTAQRTAALRAMLKDNVPVALASVAHVLALPLFYSHSREAESCLDLSIRNRDLRNSAETLGKSRAYEAVEAGWGLWKEQLPVNEAGLFDWLLKQDQATVTGLIAFCAAMSVDAVRGKQDRADTPCFHNADALAQALGLDMKTWWTPTKDSFLKRVPKKLVLEAVTEGVSKQAADNLATLKKDALAVAAEKRLSGTGWLPSCLRAAA